MAQSFAQTRVDLQTQAKNVDFSGAASTKPSKTGTTLPPTCSVGEMFFKTDAQPGQNQYACTAMNVWTALAGGVTTVFGRAGSIAAAGGDYTAAQVTNAVDRTASNTYLAGARQTFAPGTNSSGLRLTPGALPSAPQAGDLAIDANDSNHPKMFDGSTWVGMATVPNYSTTFTSATAVTVPGTTHKLGTANLVAEVYDNRTPAWHVEPDYILIDPATYNVTVYFTAPQSGRVVLSAAGGGGAGGGAGMASQLGDYGVSRYSDTVLVLGGNCSPSTPCNVRIGGTVYSMTGSSQVNLAGGTGTAYIYLDFSGNLNVGHNLTLSCSGGCTAISGITAFPVNSIPLFTWSATSNTWDSAGVDRRAFLSAKALIAGSGIVTVETGPQTLIAVDSATIPSYLSSSAALDFASIASAGCSELTLPVPGATAGDGVVPGWPAGLEAGLIGTMRVSAANTVAVRLCNLSGTPLDPASATFKATIVKTF
ncbi:MAG: hypothetical protein C5B51_27620 [Terriglobia bacterium]|nr:MAG: hypothetical protein C5B51_27620 [Terriglobia bacterium]